MFDRGYQHEFNQTQRVIVKYKWCSNLIDNTSSFYHHIESACHAFLFIYYHCFICDMYFFKFYFSTYFIIMFCLLRDIYDHFVGLQCRLRFTAQRYELDCGFYPDSPVHLA